MPLKRLAVSVALLLLVLSTSVRVPLAGDAVSESQQRLLRDIKYLASDDLEGRGVGLKGLDLAADYIRAEFAKAGLGVTAINGDAFQKFQMPVASILKEPNTLELRGPNGKKLELKLHTDFEPQSFGGSGKMDAELVFCGYGIETNDKAFDEFAGLDLKGKIAILMRRTPRQNDQATQHSMARQADLRAKVSNAVGKGVAGIVFVNDPLTGRKELDQTKQQATKQADNIAVAVDELDATDATAADKVAAARSKLTEAVKKYRELKVQAERGPTDSLMKFGYAGSDSARSIPIFHITRAACDEMLKSVLMKDLTELEAEIDKDLKPRSAVLTGWTAVGETSIEHRTAEVKNVIGVIEGEGPHADETIVIGAHYDHVGRGGAGSLAPGSSEIHNGADDNASGTVSLIELARRFGSRQAQPPRRLVFLAFTGEESGLIGSARYVKEPVFPLEKTVAMLNMDMVGRMVEDRCTVFGADTSPIWKGLLEKFGAEGKLTLVQKPEGMGPSDHQSFYQKKIPVLHFFTGNHTDYHRPGDDWEKINVGGMSRVVDVVEKLVLELASAPERPGYVEVKGSANPLRDGSRPYFGSIPDFGSDKPGYLLGGVAPGGPAEKGGLKAGDRIVQLGMKKIDNLDDFDLALRKFSAGDTADVTVIRGDKEVKLKVNLDKPR
ncbi:MAG: M20/M25/M40 family metallo-hydrolase [Planctomycetales bacterium]|nr:M20/M25/M40 family metallo-hydrolase [Planctomycetales bacterium]